MRRQTENIVFAIIVAVVIVIGAVVLAFNLFPSGNTTEEQAVEVIGPAQVVNRMAYGVGQYDALREATSNNPEFFGTQLWDMVLSNSVMIVDTAAELWLSQSGQVVPGCSEVWEKYLDGDLVGLDKAMTICEMVIIEDQLIKTEG